MTTISIFLILYIIGIIWCKWAVTVFFKNDTSFGDSEIFTKEFMQTLASWVPFVNLYLAFICTSGIIKEKYSYWRATSKVKKILRKVAKKHKGTDEGDALNKIADEL